MGLCKILNLDVLLCLFLYSGMQSGFKFASRSQFGVFSCMFSLFSGQPTQIFLKKLLQEPPLLCESRFFS